MNFERSPFFMPWEPRKVRRVRSVSFETLMFQRTASSCIFHPKAGASTPIHLMHLTYDLDEKDLQKGTRQKIVSGALAAFRVADRDGELIARVEEERFGDALFSFVQALLKVTDVTFLTRERVRSTFLEDFQSLIEETVPDTRRIVNWHDPARDPQASYAVDCRINGMRRPLMVFALPNDDRT